MIEYYLIVMISTSVEDTWHLYKTKETFKTFDACQKQATKEHKAIEIKYLKDKKFDNENFHFGITCYIHHDPGKPS